MKFGEIWLANLSPTEGHEQSGLRPIIIISHNILNNSKADLVIAIPITKTYRNISSHVFLEPSLSGISSDSYALVEQIRSISKLRLQKYIGKTDAIALQKIQKILQYFLLDA